MTKGLKIGNTASTESIERLISIIKKYCDCFCKKGTRRTIIGYEFAIDTKASPPVCCKVPRYGPHKSKIIMDQIGDILKKIIGLRSVKAHGGAKL